MVWDRDVTEKFMDACVSRKDELRKENIHLNVWKNISEDLLGQGIEKGWQVLRAKYENMESYFRKLLLNDGLMNSIPWPHYSKFCEIYDIDDDFELLGEDDEGQPDTPRKTSKYSTFFIV